jgi:hypothetical protein
MPKLPQFVKSALIKPSRFVNSEFLYMARIEAACARGALNVLTRSVDPRRPTTWEFAAFSQNGEDGIIDELLARVREPNRYFIEVGAADGLENNSSYLAYVKKRPGLMIDGSIAKSQRASELLQPLNWAVGYLSMFVTPDNVNEVIAHAQMLSPDFFSLDIDSNDFHVVKAFLEAGLRPKVVCVEYNSAFGPERSVTIPYTPGLDYLTFHPSQLYYGVSISAWRRLFAEHGYRFVTVESNGINAFFVDPAAVDLASDLEPLEFAENTTQLMRRRAGWEGQLAMIAELPLVEVA